MKNGFSLIEMLVALSVVSILFAIALPALQSYVNQAEDEQLAHLLQDTLQFARVSAELSGTNIGLNTAHPDWLLFNEETGKLIQCIKHPVKHGMLSMRAYPKNRHYLHFSGIPPYRVDDATFRYYGHEKRLVWSVVINEAGRVKIMHPATV